MKSRRFISIFLCVTLLLTLPAPAALLVQALRMADTLRPEAGYAQAAGVIWEAAAPHARQSPMACAGVIDAMMT